MVYQITNPILQTFKGVPLYFSSILRHLLTKFQGGRYPYFLSKMNETKIQGGPLVFWKVPKNIPKKSMCNFEKNKVHGMNVRETTQRLKGYKCNFLRIPKLKTSRSHFLSS